VSKETQRDFLHYPFSSPDVSCEDTADENTDNNTKNNNSSGSAPPPPTRWCTRERVATATATLFFLTTIVVLIIVFAIQHYNPETVIIMCGVFVGDAVVVEVIWIAIRRQCAALHDGK